MQSDIKKLIAYSSVSHLGFCVLGLFALNPLGLQGSVLYMLNHGLSSGAVSMTVTELLRWGVIRKVWKAVKVDGHDEHVLKALEELTTNKT